MNVGDVSETTDSNDYSDDISNVDIGFEHSLEPRNESGYLNSIFIKTECKADSYNCDNEDDDSCDEVIANSSMKAVKKLNDGSHNLSKVRLTCKKCSLQSTTKEMHKTHVLTHRKLLSCEFCSFHTKETSNLKKHILIHTGEKPFSCTYCSYRSNQKQHLTAHMAKHTNEKDFHCKFCSYKTPRKYDMKKHEITHSDVRPAREKIFPCELCSYKGATRTHVKTHQKTHTRESKLSCDFCSFIANGRSLLNTHLLNTHT